jgi:hypothetical protein
VSEEKEKIEPQREGEDSPRRHGEHGEEKRRRGRI